MLYLGGKYNLAKKLRAAMEPYIEEHNYAVWEPFCGGLNYSRVLTDCWGILSDAHSALIHLYAAYRNGWEPPERVSNETYERAKSLPDTHPLKAFAGFGMSFGGKYFGGYAGDVVTREVRLRDRAPQVMTARRAQAAARSLAPLRDGLARFELAHQDFCSVRPRHTPFLIYCDPPYQNTASYKGLPFDHRLFWSKCQQWARYTTVLVSEYACDVPHEIVWESRRKQNFTRHAAQDTGAPTERLYRVLPAYRYRVAPAASALASAGRTFASGRLPIAK